MKIFAEIVEEVQELDLHEKEELSSLLQKMIIDSRREEIFQNGQEARSLEGTYNFTSNMSELKKRLSATTFVKLI